MYMVRLFILFGLIFSSALVANAQFQQQQSVDLSINIIPTDPAPLQTVSLEAESFAVNLDQANLSWTYGGKTIANGIGQKRVSITAPAAGNVATVTVTVSGLGLTPLSASVTLNPGSIDVLWEGADAYTPPFYKGRALPAPNGVIRAVAIPSTAAPSQVSYNWTNNDSAMANISGVGRSSVLISNDLFDRSENISVTVAGGLFQGNGKVSVTPQTPTIVGYQKSEGFIDYANGSTGNVGIADGGAIIHFEPFFFSTPRDLSGLSFEMKNGDTDIFNVPKNELRISRPSDDGTSNISVGVSTNVYTLQNITKDFTFTFQ
jgi:hypothetical protein